MSNEAMEAKAAEIRRAYYKEWRAKNRDKIKVYNRNRWLKKAAALAAEQSEGNSNAERKDNQ